MYTRSEVLCRRVRGSDPRTPDEGVTSAYKAGPFTVLATLRNEDAHLALIQRP